MNFWGDFDRLLTSINFFRAKWRTWCQSRSLHRKENGGTKKERKDSSNFMYITTMHRNRDGCRNLFFVFLFHFRSFSFFLRFKHIMIGKAIEDRELDWSMIVLYLCNIYRRLVFRKLFLNESNVWTVDRFCFLSIDCDKWNKNKRNTRSGLILFKKPLLNKINGAIVSKT